MLAQNEIHWVIMRFGWYLGHNLTPEAYADEWGAVCIREGIDESIVEPCSAAEAMPVLIKGEPWDEDKVNVFSIHQWARLGGRPDIVSADV